MLIRVFWLPPCVLFGFVCFCFFIILVCLCVCLCYFFVMYTILPVSLDFSFLIPPSNYYIMY